MSLKLLTIDFATIGVLLYSHKSSKKTDLLFRQDVSNRTQNLHKFFELILVIIASD